MTIPFSHEAFLDVFGAYNEQLLPIVLLLWAVTAGVSLAWMHKRRMSGPALPTLLAFHWGWSGVVYHWTYFRGINPAARVFGAAFVLQAVLFLWLAWKGRVRFTLGHSVRDLLGSSLVVYGLAYPFVVLALGLDYPRAPIFAVPCPTTLLTAGFPLTASGLPRLAYVVPSFWAAVGASAALALEVPADWALIPAGLLLVLDSVAPSALGPTEDAGGF